MRHASSGPGVPGSRTKAAEGDGGASASASRTIRPRSDDRGGGPVAARDREIGRKNGLWPMAVGRERRADIQRMHVSDETPNLGLLQRWGEPRHGLRAVWPGKTMGDEPEQVAVRVLQHVPRRQISGLHRKRGG